MVDDIDIDARITDNLIQADLAETSLDIATLRGDELAVYYDQQELMFWTRRADWWHRKKYGRPLNRLEWRETHGV